MRMGSTDTPVLEDDSPATAVDLGKKSRGRKAGAGPAARPRDEEHIPDDGLDPAPELTLEEKRERFEALRKKMAAQGEPAKRNGKPAKPPKKNGRAPIALEEKDAPEEDEEIAALLAAGDEDDGPGDNPDGSDQDTDSEDDTDDSDEPAPSRNEALEAVLRTLEEDFKVARTITRKLNQEELNAMLKQLRGLRRQRDEAIRQNGELKKTKDPQLVEEGVPAKAGEVSAFEEQFVKPLVDDKFEPGTVEALRKIGKLVDSRVKTEVASLKAENAKLTKTLDGFRGVVSEYMFDQALQRLVVRYPQLDNERVAEKLYERTSKRMDSGDFDEIRSLPRRVAAAAEDAAGKWLLSSSEAPHVPENLRNGASETRTRSGKSSGGDQMARKKVAWDLLQSGRATGPVARRLAGVSDED